MTDIWGLCRSPVFQSLSIVNLADTWNTPHNIFFYIEFTWLNIPIYVILMKFWINHFILVNYQLNSIRILMKVKNTTELCCRMIISFCLKAVRPGTMHCSENERKKQKTSIIPICFLYILLFLKPLFLKTNDVKHKYDQLIFDKGVKEMECRNIILFNRWCWNSQTSTCKINLDTDLNTLNIN